MRSPDPRTTLVVALCLGATGVAGLASAVAGAPVLLLWMLVARPPWRPFLRRWMPLLIGLAPLLLLAPLAPRATVALVVRGLVLSTAVVTASLSVPWPSAVGLVSSLGAPRALVAFLLVLARHFASLRDETLRLGRVLLLRGALDRLSRLPAALVLLLGRMFPEALARADRTADVLLLRGFDGRLAAPEPWRPRRSDWPSYLLAAAALVACVAGLVVPEAWR